MALPSARYEPRRPTGSVLYPVVQDHFETFRLPVGDPDLAGRADEAPVFDPCT